MRLVSNRDLIIPIECDADSVIVPAGGSHRILLADLQHKDGAADLRSAVTDIINRRQSTVRANEVPYRPQVRFLVRPDGLKTYYSAFPALEPLQVPMTRSSLPQAGDTER